MLNFIARLLRKPCRGIALRGKYEGGYRCIQFRGVCGADCERSVCIAESDLEKVAVSKKDYLWSCKLHILMLSFEYAFFGILFFLMSVRSRFSTTKIKMHRRYLFEREIFTKSTTVFM